MSDIDVGRHAGHDLRYFTMTDCEQRIVATLDGAVIFGEIKDSRVDSSTLMCRTCDIEIISGEGPMISISNRSPFCDDVLSRGHQPPPED